MVSELKYKWSFLSKFRRNVFSWKASKLAADRIKEAVSEIKIVARKDPILGAEGAVLFMEKVSPALEHVDSSSGALGSAVNKAMETLVPFISKAPADKSIRDQWLERLWQALEADQMPYIEALTDHWGELCVTPELASFWADEWIHIVRMAWGEDAHLHGFFKGTSSCLSALFTASRYDEILALLEMAPYKSWSYRKWGVKALIAMGKKAEALRYAEDSHGLNDSPTAIAQACEVILLGSGLTEEAYHRYAIQANHKTTYVSTFKTITKRYPGKKASEVLDDLIASTPGSEGKWFAAAKSVGLYDKAIELANYTPCDPRTLSRAARDMADTQPEFAARCGLTALYWIIAGYGYDITGADVQDAFAYAVQAARNIGIEKEVVERIREMVSGKTIIQNLCGRPLEIVS